jgi:predicted AlkP superfamily phosphohydrolase/phosphomutase/tetratricopeptide (TPR) repeat protein
MSAPLAKKVLLIGWDAADWKIINPLVDQGLMPTLNDFINHGVIGNIATLHPILSPMLWNSIATGKRPHKHGIHGFMEPDTQTGGVRPISSTSRKVKALWNILSQRGYKSHVIGWFAGHPAEPINGVSVSDLFPFATNKFGEPWPLPPGAVHPESLRDTFAPLRMHPAEVTEAAILPMIPLAARVDQEKDKRLHMFAKILSENCSIHNAATWILEHEEWDFLAVYYNGIDHFCHGFMHFHPPRLPGIQEDQFEIYKDVVNSAYRFHDMMLERLLQLAGPDATVLLLSDHGFHSDHLRPLGIPKEPAGPAVQHRPLGVFAMRGAGIKQDERIYGATLLDIAPTVLTLFGLPVGEDMDGRVLVQAFEAPPQIERIPSWEQVPGECGMHPSDLRMDPAAAQAMLQQFVALGYIQEPSADQKTAVANCIRELNYNLARALMDAQRPREALAILSKLMEDNPDQSRFAQHTAQCHLVLGQRAEAKAILEKLIAAPPETASAQASQPAAPESAEPKRRPWADWMMGILLHEESDYQGALNHLLSAEAAQPLLPDLHLALGRTYLRMGHTAEAGRAFERALEIDGESPQAFHGLAVVALRRRENERAADYALRAVGLQHFLPVGHYHLGVALVKLGDYERAILAFETAVSMTPGLLNAHRYLVALHTRTGGDPGKSVYHRRMVEQLSLQRRQRSTIS